MELEYYRSKTQLADIFTKALKCERFKFFGDFVGVVCVDATLA